MFRTWLTTTVITAATAVGVTATAAAPALAAAPAGGPCDQTTTVQTSNARPFATETPARALVQHLAIASPYGAVRAAAMTALNSPRGDVAIAEFISKGWCEATRRAERDASMNDHIIQRVLATHSHETSPRVYTAAQARLGTATQKEAFVRRGLEEARAADQRVRDESGDHAAALRQQDRDYVAQLRDSAQGEQVRVAAAWATRAGSTDSDIVEFYTYAWARFGKLDLERFQLETAEQEMRWLAAIDRLRQAALRAQVAAEEASGEAQKALKEQAADAWAKVAGDAEVSASTWQQAKRTADAQAAHWQAVYLMALKQPGPNWKAMNKPSRANRDAWERDIRNAEDRAAFWQQVVADARAAEEILRPTDL